MKRTLLSVIALSVWCGSAWARPIRTLDMDALVFGSDVVVEGQIESTHSANYDLSAEVRVQKTLLGADLSGQRLSIPGLGLYRKQPDESEPHWEGIGVDGTKVRYRFGGDRKTGALSAGDHLILFLNRGSQLLSTGVKLVRGEEVSGFRQMGNPGGLGEIGSVSRAKFDADLGDSQARIGDFRSHLQNLVSTPGDYWLRWIKNRTAAKLNWGGTDSIRREALTALVEGQNWPELAAVLELPPDSDHSLVVTSFNCPGGRNYLLKRLGEAGETRAHRLQWVPILRENVGIQSRVFGGEAENGGDLLRRVSRLALGNRADDGLSRELVQIAVRFLGRATGNGYHVPKTLRVGLMSAVEDLRVLRAQTRFAQVKAQINVALALANRRESM